MRKFFALFCFVLLAVTTAVANVHYVSTTGANQWPYDTWAKAARSIQDAVIAGAAGDTVLVNDGTYNIASTLEITSPITVRSVNGKDKTVINGTHTFRGVLLSNSAVLDGFAITHFRAGTGLIPDGGGVCIAGSGTLQNCTVYSCTAMLQGGGVLLDGGGLMQNCLIWDNYGDDSGGGVQLRGGGTVKNCTIYDNWVRGGGWNYGGGVAIQNGGTVENCLINGNRSDQKGGGVHITGSGTVRNSCITGNNATNFGGGVYLEGGGLVERCLIQYNETIEAYPNGLGGGAYINGAGIVRNCTIYLNIANACGGGIAIAGGGVVANSLIYFNHAMVYHGGGVYLMDSSAANNCTIVDNSAGTYGGGIMCLGGSALIFNSIIRFNWANVSYDDFYDQGGNSGYYRCCLPWVPAVGSGTITSDPGFMDYARNNYRLNMYSPCRDNAVAPYPTADVGGNARIINGDADIGAYEFGGVLNDFDCNGKSDLVTYEQSGLWRIKDLTDSVVTKSWGFPGTQAFGGDYDKDGIADLGVYQLSSGHWFVLSGVTPCLYDYALGYNGAKPVVGDYDGDGADDPAVFDSNTGKWFIYSSWSGSPIVWNFGWGWKGVLPVAGDYDGDGASDIAIYYPPTGLWYIYSVKRGVALVWGTSWGYTGCVPVAGDFDGDGAYDLAVYDPTRYTWWIRSVSGTPSLRGGLPLMGSNWGFKGGLPMAGDYNGDGAFDMAIYNPSTTGWFIRSLDGAYVKMDVRWGAAGAALVKPQ